jgi:hypothetical protein
MVQTAAEFEAELRRLVRAAGEGADNTGSIEVIDCRRCVECTFCARSVGLYRCHYCTDSERLVSSTHCRSSRDLSQCNHCTDSERCMQSSYLVRCFDCTACSYCFGCVGLVGKDFHILNQPYSRSDYFATLARLQKQLGR